LKNLVLSLKAPIFHFFDKLNFLNLFLKFGMQVAVRFGSGLGESDLGDAYRRAGVTYRGQLQQNFVVLHEAGAGNEERVRPKASTSVVGIGTPKKRTREEVGVEPESKTPRKPAEPERKK
jgi:hypothetical protein